MWKTYDYLCTDCDALIEITTLKEISQWRGWCPCGSPNLISTGVFPVSYAEPGGVSA